MQARLALAWIASLLPLVAPLVPTAARAWGNEGHTLVCEIAFQEMEDREARDEIKALMRAYKPVFAENEQRYQRFNEGCTFPDHPRTRPHDHYVNLARSDRALVGSACPPGSEEGRCALVAIRDDLATLRDKSQPAAKRVRALMSLGHWVGDLHQPLHVSFADDRGGNGVESSGHVCAAENLHSVWDGCLVDFILDGRSIDRTAQDLRDAMDDGDRAEWAPGSAFTPELPVAWTNESFDIATSAGVGYCERKSNGKCARRSGVAVNGDYVKRNAPIAQQRILMAGVRLGRLLDEALGD